MIGFKLFLFYTAQFQIFILPWFQNICCMMTNLLIKAPLVIDKLKFLKWKD